MSLPDICIVAGTSFQQREKAAALARKLGLPLEDNCKNRSEFHLVYTDIRLELQANPSRAGQKEKPIYIDLLRNSPIHQRLLSASIKDPLCRAVGIKSGRRPSVVDATAGMGVDGITLAWMGCSVVLIERDPVVHALLQDGLQRAAEDELFRKRIGDNLTLIEGDSTEILPRLPVPETVLVDPMYPQTARGALNKKEMRILRKVVGEDMDSRELFAAALRTSAKRVVVKRPKNSEPICAAPEPSHRILMKSGRFDIYLL